MRFLVSLVLLFSGWLMAVEPANAQKKADNILLIICDDMGLDMAAYGNDAIKTPNLDKLAKNGVVFTNAYATVASCSASRGSILTGLYTHQNGQFGHAHLPHGQTTFPWVQSLPYLLNQAGYFTGLIGKFHVAPNSSYPFDELMTRKTGGNRDPILMNERAREFLKKAKKKPFFLVYSSSDPHRAGKGFGNERFKNRKGEITYDPKDVIVPYFLPDQPEVRKELAEYYQATSRFDRGVGMLLETLREMGFLDNTLIIFISDNGIPFPGAKTNVYGAGVHLPLIISSPDHKKGHRNDALVNYVDLAPTILDRANAKGPSKYKLPGRSLLPILNEKSPKGWDETWGSHQFHEVTMYYPMRFLQTRKYKYILNIGHKLEYPFASDLWACPTWQGVMKRGDDMMGKRKVKDYLYRPLEELFDTTKDPNELNNLAYNPKYAKVMEEMRSRMQRWQRQTNDPWDILYRDKEFYKKGAP